MKNGKVLNKEQLTAIRHGDGPLLIIAGAGTGKTTVVTERIKYLILEKKVHPSQILALTFTEKAAREMEERVDVAMPYGYTQMWISTFHAFCDRILRNEAVHIGLTPSYTLMTEAETIMFLRQNLFKFNLAYFRPLGNPHKFLEGLLQHFSRLRDEDISPDEYLAWVEKQKKTSDLQKDEIEKMSELANAFKQYEKIKAKEGVMDFADLISNTLTLFRTRAHVLTQYQKQFQYVLVDEFQDTNFAQNTLALLLAGQRKNITVVGDDDQAIYRWRGAAISNMIQFRKQFPKAKIVTLSKNYRSTQEILDRAYSLIQNNNPDRLEAKEGINKKLLSQKNAKTAPVTFLFADRVEDEAELVISKIKETVKKKDHKYADIAILVRANDHAQAFTRSLSRHGIPYQFLGPGRLFHQEEVKDLIAYLKVLYNFEDTTSLYRVLNLPVFNIDARDIASLLNLGKRKNYTLFEALEHSMGENPEVFLSNDAREKITKIVTMIKKHLKRVSKDSAGQILYYFLEESGLTREFLAPKNETEAKRYQNIAKFFDKLKTYEAEHEVCDVFAVVDWIDLSMQMGESPISADMDWTENNAVNILTIHSSKGLEFPIVFLVNLVAQRFPTRERREQLPIPQELIKEILPEGDFHMQEERRLFYVGMTRAKQELYLTAAKFYGEGKRERKISPFVYEALGEESVNEYLSKQKLQKTVVQPTLLDWATQDEYQVSSIKYQVSNPITYISYSQLQTFDICPLHYKLKYILKVPTPQSAAQSFGTSIHQALRDFYQQLINGEKMTTKDMPKILQRLWINEGYQSKAHERAAYARADHLLSSYLDKYFIPKDKEIPIALEVPFQFYIKNPANPTEMLKIGGRIDRIDKIDDKRIEIIDYKTGINMPTEKEAERNLQLTMYGLAAMSVNDPLLSKNPQDVLLSLYYIEEDKKLTTTRTKEQLEECVSDLFAKAAEIASSDYRCSGSTFCLNCEYKMLCHV